MRTPKTLAVNSAAPIDSNSIRVNLRTTVNAASIRRETYNGREHIVIPSYTLPADVVMNRGLYPGEEIDKAYPSLEGTLAPLSHPMLEGEYVSARTPEAINAYHVGAFNRNVEKRGDRVYLEKYIDIETAGQSEGGRRLLAAVAAGEPIHTSTGVFLRREPVDDEDDYDWIARDMDFDHDAILLDEPGAAGPDQGVGMMVNTVLVPNLGERVLGPDTWGARMDTISSAVRKRFGRPDSWVCVGNFDDRRVVYSTPEGSFYIDYLILDGAARLEGEPLPVQAETAYYARNSLVNKFWQWMRNALSSETSTPPEPSEDQDMKPEELQALLDQQAENMTQAVNAAVAPVVERVNALESSLAANAEAALAAKRTEAAALLGVEADTLAGMTANALDAVIVKHTPAAPLLHGLPVANRADLVDYDKPTV